MFSTALERAAPAARSLFLSCLLVAAVGSAAEPVPSAPLPLTTAVLGDAAATQFLAQHLEFAGDARAVDLRQAAVVAAPDQIEARLALVHTALRFGQLPVAQRALDDLATLAPPSPRLTEATAALDYASGYQESAADALGASLASHAADPLPEWAATALDLRLGSAATAGRARLALNLLLNARPTDVSLRRELIRDALRQHDRDAARRLSASTPAPTFDDLLLRAEIDLPDDSAALGARAAQSPADAALWVAWLIARDQAAAALRWIDEQPPALQSDAAVRRARADACAALQQWDRALPLLAAGAWGEIPPAVLTAAAAARTQENSSARASAWAAVLRAAGDRPGALRVLYRLTLCWRLPAEREAVLLALTHVHPAEGWAFQALAELYRGEKSTAKLAALYTRWHAAEPTNLAVDANRLLVAVLTARKATAEQRAAIDDLLTFNPDQPLLGIARALALWQHGRTDEAFAATQALPSALRHRSSLALYHGLFIAMNGGGADEAQPYLTLAATAALLPEEQSLLQTARNALGQIARR